MFSDGCTATKCPSINPHTFCQKNEENNYMTMPSAKYRVTFLLLIFPKHNFSFLFDILKQNNLFELSIKILFLGVSFTSQCMTIPLNQKKNPS